MIEGKLDYLKIGIGMVFVLGYVINYLFICLLFILVDCEMLLILRYEC